MANIGIPISRLTGHFQKIRKRLSCKHEYQFRGSLDTDGTGKNKICYVCTKCNNISWKKPSDPKN